MRLKIYLRKIGVLKFKIKFNVTKIIKFNDTNRLPYI